MALEQILDQANQTIQERHPEETKKKKFKLSMLTKGNNMDYVINFIITKRVCESFDNNFEQYVRTHYVKLLKRSQKIEKSTDKDRFNLAQSLAFYLHQDNELMDSNFDGETDEQQK